MDLKVLYDQDVNALNILTNEVEMEDTCIPLRDEGSVVLGVPYGDMCHIVSMEALGASAWLPLGKRDYDAETDTLTIGLSSGNKVLVTENGDIVGYWVPDELEPSDSMDAIGVALRNASVHLGKMQVLGVKRKA